MSTNDHHGITTGRQLRLSTELRGDELIVAIGDTGCGIAPKDLARIFEPFFTTKPSGTGLGLSVVQNIIHEHRGRIDIESQPGTCTTVRVRLPTTT